MQVNGILEELEAIFADVLDTPGLHLTPESNASNVDGWDSLAHITLVAAVEARYRIRFALGELQDLKNVGEMVALIGEKSQLVR